MASKRDQTSCPLAERHKFEMNRVLFCDSNLFNERKKDSAMNDIQNKKRRREREREKKNFVLRGGFVFFFD
jgi:hypothetical protein